MARLERETAEKALDEVYFKFRSVGTRLNLFNCMMQKTRIAFARSLGEVSIKANSSASKD